MTIKNTITVETWSVTMWVVVINSEQRRRVKKFSMAERTLREELDGKALAANVKAALHSDSINFQSVQLRNRAERRTLPKIAGSKS
jgi:hypothetical protein